MFCWLVMPLPRLVSVAKLVLSSLVLLDGLGRSKSVFCGGGCRLHLLAFCLVVYTAVHATAHRRDAVLLPEEQPCLPALRSRSALQPSKPPIILWCTCIPALPCSAADVGFSRLLSNTHLSMQSGAAGTYAYAGEAGLHPGPHLGSSAPVPAFFIMVIATWLGCRVCVSSAPFEHLLMSARIGSCCVWSPIDILLLAGMTGISAIWHAAKTVHVLADWMFDCQVSTVGLAGLSAQWKLAEGSPRAAAASSECRCSAPYLEGHSQ